MKCPVGGRAALALVVALGPATLPLGPAAAAPSSKEVARSQERANRAAARLSRAQSALAEAERGIAELEARTVATGAQLGELETQVRRLAVDRYVRGVETVHWIGTGDVTESARRRALLRYVSLVQTDAVQGFRVAKSDYDADKEELDRRLAAQRASVGKLRSEQARARTELDRLGAAQKAAETRAAARRAAAGRARPGAAPGPDATRILGAGGPWTCPVQGPRAFSNDWGQPRSGGRSHKGNDILAPRGTPVVASVGGTVKANNSSLGGIAYYLRGDDGNTYYGAHLDRLGATGRVSAGTVIGYVGTSGNARGGPPHLHFEVHPGHGRAANPFSLLRRFC